MNDLVKAFTSCLEDKIFLEVLNLVKQNSRGKIWIIGGFLYKNLANILYNSGREIYNYDVDFIVEEKNDVLKDISGWKIQANTYGNQNYVRDGNKMSFTGIKNFIRISGMQILTIEDYTKETPFNIQSIAYDLDQNKIIGEKGIEALKNQTVRVNNKEEAEFYAKREGKKLEDIIAEKTRELGFNVV